MEENTVKKSKKILVIGGVIIIGLLLFGISSYASSKAFESTANAEPDAELLPVKACIIDYIDEMQFKDNQIVKKVEH